MTPQQFIGWWEFPPKQLDKMLKTVSDHQDENAAKWHCRIGKYHLKP